MPENELSFELDGTGISAVDLVEDQPAEADSDPIAKPMSAVKKLDAAHKRLNRRLNQSTYLYFDLETVPDESRIEEFGLPELPKWKGKGFPQDAISGVLDGVVGDIEKRLASEQLCEDALNRFASEENKRDKPRKGVLAAIEKSKRDRRAALGSVDDRRKLLSVTPEYCRIVALGFAVGGAEADSFTADYHSEHEMLGAFWSMAIECKHLIGFKILHFDLPVIFVRSMLLGVDPTRTIDMKPWSNDVVDLYVRRFGARGNTGKGPGKLKDLARLHGIDVPAGDVDGGDVVELLESDPEKLGEYVRSDVEITRALHRKYQGFFC